MDFSKLAAISKDRSFSIEELTADQLTELQIALAILGYPAGDLDGLYGPKIRNAWAEFAADFPPGDGDVIDSDAVTKLQRLLDERKPTIANDFSTPAGTIEAIRSECLRQGIVLKSQIAYLVATADHETNHTFKPVTEAYWLTDPDAYLRERHPDYYPYYGRGFVQLTWKKNYEKYGRMLGKDLVANPSLALEPEISLFILVHGFKTGLFTGRTISDYVDAQKADFVNARRCINGLDKAEEIAARAVNYLARI